MDIEITHDDLLTVAACAMIADSITRLLEAPLLIPAVRTHTVDMKVMKANYNVSVIVIEDSAIQILNRTWRKIDAPTDVLSWPSAEVFEPLLPHLGDIAISIDTARSQANLRNWSLEEELSLLAVHGFLHLLGHDDDEDEDAEKMRSLERFAMGKPLEKHIS